MRTYSTDLVAGDTAVRVADLKAGDVVRSFNGLSDTLTVSAITRTMRQGAVYVYDIVYSDGTRSQWIPAGEVRYLPTGGPREAEKASPVDDDFNVCTDCYMQHHTGESDPDADRTPWALMPGADVTDNMPEDGEPYFSWSACPACGSTLGGNRYRMAVWGWGE